MRRRENPYTDAVGDTAELDDWDSMLAVVEGRRTIELRSDDPDLPPADRVSFDKWGFRTTIDTPLVYGDRVIGVLGLVETRELRRFTPAEHTLFGQLAVQAAIAIDKRACVSAAGVRTADSRPFARSATPLPPLSCQMRRSA